MGQYSIIIDDMTWSYSRIRSYLDCPYSFFLKYIQGVPKERKFFSDYGSFMHHILQAYYAGSIPLENLALSYLQGFQENVQGRAPSSTVFTNYFRQGLDFLSGNVPSFGKVLATEKPVSFTAGGLPFIGFVDLVVEDSDGLSVVDHKSRTLKPRSTRKKPTKTDEELDEYLTQLYLYSIALGQETGQLPQFLIFNCFRNPSVIKEPFSTEKMRDAEAWAKDSVQTIREDDNFKPNVDPFRCRNLCDVCRQCDYFQLYSSH